ncbi:hypothetical protein DO97_20815 [Neosynechococcus sphagnicola sy1]|uniref:histidine kinase n=1 Tax=Neosynechococcus sphagnicola sy1 TaxID=1497020 RepID=A0A098TLU2_9CYAN|nr:PAS domain-containing protein [Neosynechococcus sphagnicola]KGF73280.1 hypothetical protein DO97_20815 [Neosynechococcus sphagnicola sy1]
MSGDGQSQYPPTLGQDWEEVLLQQRPRSLKTLIDALPGIVFFCDSDAEWSMKYLSRGCLALTGYTSEELVGPERLVSYNAITHADDLPKVLATISRAIALQQSYVIEYRICTKSGQQKWLWEKGHVVMDEAGQFVGLEGFITDISDLKSTEAKLLQTTSELQAIFQALPDLYFRLDGNGTILDYHAGRPEDLYLSPREFLGQRMHSLLPGEVCQQFEQAIESVVNTNSLVTIEYELLIAGCPQAFEARLSPLLAQEIIVIIRNITDRKQAEAHIRRANALLQAQKDGVAAAESRLRKLNVALVKLARRKISTPSDLNRVLREITEAATRTLEVERASIWRFTGDRSRIQCLDLFERSVGRHSSGTELTVVEAPAYLQALEDHRTLAAHQAHTDPRTEELSASYLTPLNIHAILDAAIHVGGSGVWGAVL